MAIEEVSITKIKPNPFSVRKKSGQALSDEAINSLAGEIKDLGWFGGTLKARKNGSHYQIAFGHRRLEALKKLGHKTLTLDVEDLTDEQMQLFMAVENFQRHTHTDEEKLAVWKMVKDQVGSSAKAMRLLGVSKETAQAYDKALEYKERGGQQVALPPKTLLVADRLGGEEMAKTAAKKKMSAETISDISAEISRVAGGSTTRKQRLKDAAAQGKILHPDQVKKVDKEIAMDRVTEFVKKAKKEAPPPDLVDVIKGWVQDLPDIIAKLEEVASNKNFVDYIIEEDPKLASELKKQLEKLIKVAIKLDDNIVPRLEG